MDMFDLLKNKRLNMTNSYCIVCDYNTCLVTEQNGG